MKTLLSIIKFPWLILYVTIGLMAFIPHVPSIVKHIKDEGGSLDWDYLCIYIEETMPWVNKIGDIPQTIKIIISLLIYFYLLY